MILDKYFKSPLFWDYFLSIILIFICYELINKHIILLPKTDEIISITTDITNISLTISGFILTLLTVLITFKTSNNVKKIELDSDKPLFELFFASGLYFETTKHLKNCIKSLILVSVLGFSFKIFLSNSSKVYLYYFNILGLLIIALTLYRCLLILTKIVELQKNESQN